MRKVSASLRGAFAAAIVLAAILSASGSETFDVPLENPGFTAGTDDRGLPSGWNRYGGGGTNQRLEVVDAGDGGRALLIVDGDPTAEIGVSQSFPLRGGETYEAAVQVRAVPDGPPSGAYLQFRFLPSHHMVQTGLTARSTDRFGSVSVRATAPPDTTHAVIYLYTHRQPTPRVLVTGVRVTGGLPPPPPPPPPPVPPQYDTLKDLHREIHLVRDGRPNAAIVAPAVRVYQAAAADIQREIKDRTGVTLPIVADDDPQAALPLQGHRIVIGNRSTNKTIGALYDLYYCLVDLKYPGPEGYVIRTVHNPFGNGHSVVLVGASDDVGVERGTRALAEVLAKATGGSGEMALGWTMQTQLGRGVKPPTELREFKTWEDSKGYGSIGYFGWCSISKRMAMYYMTGDEFSAREFVRLAFPDRQALKEIEEIDGERIENKQDPLAGFYHYNAHLAILFWDLIEESPVFTDDERLKITNAFARQLNHRRGEGIYGRTQPPNMVGTRHGQWSAISLYCLGRYFDKYYPDPVWAHCVRASELAFQSLHQHAWVAGESDNLFWYNTGTAPILTYMVLSGDRKPQENGVLDELLRAQEVLISGRVPDWALNSAALDYLHKAAYLTGDGRWVTYRQRTGVDTDVFRLGQSFWPEPTIEPALPLDLVDAWTVHRLPEPAWTSRGSGLPLDESFYVASFRSAPDASGDYLLLDGFNGASRNPYHTFAILELRLDGRTMLQGYHNQVQTSADGMVEPRVAMDAALRASEVVGPTALAVGEVPQAAFCNWRRTICQRTGRYALVVDDLTFRTDSQNMRVDTAWQAPGGRWNQQDRAIRVPGGGSSAGGTAVELRSCDDQEVAPGRIVTMTWTGSVAADQRRCVFYLIGRTDPQSGDGLACERVAENAAVLGLPQAALAVAGQHGQMHGELVVLAEDHLYGHGLRQAGIGSVLVSSDVPVDLDWDFARGELHVVVTEPTVLQLGLAAPDEVRIGDQPLRGSDAAGLYQVSLAPGRHALSGASPAAKSAGELGSALRQLLVETHKQRAEAEAVADAPAAEPAIIDLPVAFTTQVAGPVAAMIQIPSTAQADLCLATGQDVHVLSPEGNEIRRLQTDGKVRVLRWWKEHDLLLAGCVDEQVVAFDSQGRRRWSYTSEMDPAVYEAAKTYWFKSAPGHEGIHGLYTGGFDEGKSRCFVGSACTLEILDETGSLVKRTPVFWGPGVRFLLVPGPAGSTDLLVARWPNGTDQLAIVNSRTMATTGRGYAGVPAGHSYVGGWTAQNRTGLFHEDLDGDGTKEIATAINGTWNRVTVYSEQGKPLYNAQFGPGPGNVPRAQMRDMDLADINVDGKKEIVVGIAEGLVVALSHRCEKRWSVRLPSPPVSLRCIQPRGAGPTWIVVGCEDGSVAVLDGQGTLRQRGQVNGRPTHMVALPTVAGTLAVLATDRGAVTAFRIGD